jgi:type IV secretory pathway VirB4 component
MLQYHSRRHRRLMDESEQALVDASQSESQHESRISSQILADNKIHGIWEARHARMLLPVAEHRKTTHQIIQLRMMSTTLVHGRALIEYIRDHEIRGDERERFFACYYRLTDYQNAVLAAHRDYMLSVSSKVSTDHLIDLMYDPTSHRLLQQYSKLYKQYFELTSAMATSDDAFCNRALAPLAESAKSQVHRLRRKLQTEPPDSRCNELERQASLAQSGRYPVLNYLVV